MLFMFICCVFLFVCSAVFIMKTSSSVFASLQVLIRLFGVPSLTVLPLFMIVTWLQSRFARSMSCVAMSTVLPVFVNDFIICNSMDAASGSSPR